MALGTLGTTANNGLTSMVWNPMSPVADVAAIAAHILSQGNPTHPIFLVGNSFANNWAFGLPWAPRVYSASSRRLRGLR